MKTILGRSAVAAEHAPISSMLAANAIPGFFTRATVNRKMAMCQRQKPVWRLSFLRVTNKKIPCQIRRRDRWLFFREFADHTLAAGPGVAAVNNRIEYDIRAV